MISNITPSSSSQPGWSYVMPHSTCTYSDSNPANPNAMGYGSNWIQLLLEDESEDES
jgi:hypothetical protein